MDVHNSGHIESHDFFTKFGQAADDFVNEEEGADTDKYEHTQLERAKIQRIQQHFRQFSKK